MERASYAMRDEDSQGRRFPEAPHPYRSEYQRDRDRIIHTKAFRRLENKTQVFDPDYSDHFRNRLTHTLEVSQISRTIATACRLNADLCEVLALSHDIGHPPFSHEGEKVLDQLMKKHGSGFDHNLHALRIVEDFEEKYAGFRGLNLTFEVREGIIKHSRDYQPGETAYVDVSPYRPGERPPLEAQIIDLADEIAYNSADLDDGYGAGILKVDQLVEEVTLFREAFLQVRKRYPGVDEALQVSESVRRIIDILVTSLIRQTELRIREEGIETVEDVRRFPRRLVEFDQETARKNRELKVFLQNNLYQHEGLLRARVEARRLVEKLFEYYLERPQDLPANHYQRIQSSDLPRVVCDYIAGMTDKYAHSKYEALLAGQFS